VGAVTPWVVARDVASGCWRDVLIEHAEVEIGYLAGLADIGRFQADRLRRAGPVEEADTVAERDGRGVDADFVDQGFLDAFAGDVGVDDHDDA
jgi:hypothetical protein